MKFRMTVVVLTVLLSVTTGCTTIGRIHNKKLVADVLIELKAAMTDCDVDAAMALYSENYSGPQNSTRDQVRLILEYAMPLMAASGDTGFDSSGVTIEVDGAAATAGPVGIAVAGREFALTYELAKEDDGVWRIIGSKME